MIADIIELIYVPHSINTVSIAQKPFNAINIDHGNALHSATRN